MRGALALVRALVLAPLSLLAACAALPYQPATATVGALPDGAFDRALDVVRVRFPHLDLVDRGAFRIQTAWIPHQARDRPGETRATVFLQGSDLAVVVETRWLGLDLFGAPRWSSASGDPRLERELLAALSAALGAS